jgi:hypothetical protein
VSAAVKSHLHHAADFEFDGSLLRNFDALERLRILSHSRRSDFALEHAEISKFQAVAAAQFVDDVVKKSLNDALHDDALVPRSVRNAIDEFLLGDGSHDGNPGKRAPFTTATGSPLEREPPVEADAPSPALAPPA